MQVELDAEARLELAAMVYARWSRAWDSVKAVRAETWESTGRFCGKEDWPGFHAARTKQADEEMALAKRLREAICPYSPIVKGE